MTQAGIHGLPGLARIKRLRRVVTSEDLVNRNFHRLRPELPSSTSYSPRTTPFGLPVSHQARNPNGGAGKPVTQPCTRPHSLFPNLDGTYVIEGPLGCP